MSENIVVALIGLIGVLLGGGGVSAYIALRKSRTEIKVLDTQGTANIAKALSDAALAMSAIVNESQEQRKELSANNQTLEQRVNELEAHRIERSQMIFKLQADITILEEKIRKDFTETQKLRNEVQVLRSQVQELEGKNERYSRINKKLIQALEDAKISLPDMNGDLTDTVEKWKKQ